MPVSTLGKSGIALAAALMILGVGCSKHEEAASTAPAAPPTGPDAAAITAAVGNPHRLGGDPAEDAWRKPTEVLTFLEVRPGIRVVDYFSAGGYYTELLSAAVGPQGQVIAYNNPEYLKFSGEQPTVRYGANRLPNVAQMTTPVEEAPFEPASLDAALFVMSYHDLYWRPEKAGSLPAADAAKALAKLVAGLKSGAPVVVLDHVATAGSDPLVSVDAMHRIDPAIVKRDFEAAGLKFDTESPAFANASDDHTKEVFD